MTFLSKLFLTTAVTLCGTIAQADTVVIYSAAPQQMIDELLPMFEEASGHDAELIKAGSGELLNRLRAEQGQQTADVIWSVDGSLLDLNAELFAPYTPSDADKFYDIFRTSDIWTPFTAVVMAFAVNEDALGRPACSDLLGGPGQARIRRHDLVFGCGPIRVSLHSACHSATE